MNPGSDFTETGLPIGENNVNMTYLYGVSDFFTTMFEDPERVNLILEASSQTASEAYSKFLQLTSSLSLDDIRNTIGCQLKLITLKSSDAIFGEMNTYKLPLTLLESKYIANRPMLPTTLLEDGPDYRLEVKVNGDVNIRFAKDISDAGFSTRLLSDGLTKEYALWFVDVQIDERWVAKLYGNIIGLDPQNSTDQFRNFVYGLYYTYIHGPTLDDLRKGLNLVLGIPLARDNETVLDIRTYLETDQYIVIGEKNQYLVPYGLPPIVKIGDVLKVGDEIAQWVEIKDYRNDGDWWINLYIPQNIIPELPAGQPTRYALAGTHYDQIMRNYLKTHTFLVNVKVEAFKGIENFQELSEILRKARPSYTRPIYVWTVNQTETLNMTDEGDESFLISIEQYRSETFMSPIGRMVRKDQIAPLSRNEPYFQRWTMNANIKKTVGLDPFINGDPAVFQGGVLDGYVNPTRQFRDNTPEEASVLTTLMTRGGMSHRASRSHMGFYRNSLGQNGHAGIGVNIDYGLAEGLRMVPLYVTKQADLAAKCASLDLETPPLGSWVFDLLNPASSSYEINGYAVNEQQTLDEPIPYHLRQSYDVLFQRGSAIQYLGSILPESAYESWIPDLADLRPNDYIFGIRIYEDILGLYWVTSNQTVAAPFLGFSEEPDPLHIEFEAPLTRNSNGLSNPFYFLRGRGKVTYNRGNDDTDTSPLNPNVTENEHAATFNGSALNTEPFNTSSTVSPGSPGDIGNSSEINGDAINEPLPDDDNIYDVNYSDMYNETQRMTRDGRILKHVMEV